MTDSTRVLRGRRPPSLESVPDQLAEWFAGSIADTWYRLLPNEVELLPARWRSYKAEHPDAVAPPNYSWLDDPADPRHPSEAEVRAARAMLLRDK